MGKWQNFLWHCETRALEMFGVEMDLGRDGKRAKPGLHQAALSVQSLVTAHRSTVSDALWVAPLGAAGRVVAQVALLPRLQEWALARLLIFVLSCCCRTDGPKLEFMCHLPLPQLEDVKRVSAADASRAGTLIQWSACVPLRMCNACKRDRTSRRAQEGWRIYIF